MTFCIRHVPSANLPATRSEACGCAAGIGGFRGAALHGLRAGAVAAALEARKA